MADAEEAFEKDAVPFSVEAGEEPETGEEVELVFPKHCYRPEDVTVSLGSIKCEGFAPGDILTVPVPVKDGSTNPKAKFGATKPDLSLIPPVAMAEEAMAYENGAYWKGYGPFNWRDRAVDARTYVAAIKRHVDAWLDGEEYCSDAPDVHNLGAARAGLGILLDARAQGSLVDNRPTRGHASRTHDDLQAKKVAREKRLAEGEKK